MRFAQRSFSLVLRSWASKSYSLFFLYLCLHRRTLKFFALRLSTDLISINMSRPKIIFGTATVGMGFDDPQTVSELLEFLKGHNINYIDTAGRYPPLKPGLSETLLGQVNAAHKGFVLDTKILAGPGDGSGELASSAIRSSLSTSLERLNVDSVRIVDATEKPVHGALLTRVRSMSCIVTVQTHKLHYSSKPRHWTSFIDKAVSNP